MKRNEALKMARLIKFCAKELLKNEYCKFMYVHDVLGQQRTDEVPTTLMVENDGGFRGILFGDNRGNVSYNTNNRSQTIKNKGYIYLYVDLDGVDGYKYKDYISVNELANRICNAYNDMVAGADNSDKDSYMFKKGDVAQNESFTYLANELKRYVDMINNDIRTAGEILGYYLN